MSDSRVDNALTTLHFAETEEERLSIYRFRYRVYVEEMGKRPGAADHQHRILRDELDETGVLLYIRRSGQVIATLRLNLWRNGPFPDFVRRVYRLERFEDFPLEDINLSSRLMVELKSRGTPVIGTLLAAGYTYLRENGLRFDFCNCSPSLIPFYEQIGHRRYTDNYVDPDVGFRVPLVLMLEDAVHLRDVRSPLYRLARKWPKSRETADWFARSFPEHAGFVSARRMAIDDFWDYIENKLFSKPHETISLLEGLNEEQAKHFFKMATVLKCKEGDAIIRPGDVGQEMFVILSGIADVQCYKNGQMYSVATFTTGQVFGEIAFISKTPRTAYVIARSEMEVLVITPRFLKTLSRKAPELSSQILYNLCMTLCERLQSNTANFISAVSEIEEQ